MRPGGHPGGRWVLGLLAAFVASAALAAVASSYGLLLAARLLTALTHAAFWSVVAPVATSLFPPEARARVMSVLFAGISLAPVAGVPAGTWLGDRHGWHAAFWAVTLLGAGCLAALVPTLPAATPGETAAARGARPDAGAYRTLIAVTLLAVTGAFTAYSYFAPLVTDVGGLPGSAVGGCLLLFGVAGTAGIVLAGRLVDRRPGAATVVPPFVVGAALLVVAVLGGAPAVLLAAIVAWGAGMAAIPSVFQTRVLVVAPGDTSLASATYVAAFNAGIGGGALLGAAVLDVGGVRPVVVAGALLSLAGGLAALARLAPGGRRPRYDVSGRRGDTSPRPRTSPRRSRGTTARAGPARVAAARPTGPRRWPGTAPGRT